MRDWLPYWPCSVTWIGGAGAGAGSIKGGPMKCKKCGGKTQVTDTEESLDGDSARLAGTASKPLKLYGRV